MYLAQQHGRILCWEQYTESKWFIARRDLHPPTQTWKAGTCKNKDPCASSTLNIAVVQVFIPPTRTPKPLLHFFIQGKVQGQNTKGLRSTVSCSTPLFDVWVSWDLAFSNSKKPEIFPSTPPQSSCLYFYLPPPELCLPKPHWITVAYPHKKSCVL